MESIGSELDTARAAFREYALHSHLFLVGLAFSVLGFAISTAPRSCESLGQFSKLICLGVVGLELLAWLSVFVAGVLGISALRAGERLAIGNFYIAQARANLAELPSEKFDPTPLVHPDGTTTIMGEFRRTNEDRKTKATQEAARAAKSNERRLGGLFYLLILGLMLLALARATPQVHQLWWRQSDSQSIVATPCLSTSVPPETMAHPTIPLRDAVVQGNREQVVLNLYWCKRIGGCNVNEVDDTQSSLLHRAAAWRRTEIVKLLLEAGANIAAQDQFGSSPLAKAASVGNAETVRLLVESGADARARDKELVTPLHSATLCISSLNCDGTAEKLRVLLAAGADINAKTAKGETPLKWASSLNEEAEEVLLKHGGTK